MATMQEYIERLIYQFTSTGADQVANDMNKVGAAQTTTSTSALNLEKSFNSLERRMDSSVRAAQDYASIQAKVAAAVAQNPALQERANNILALAEQRYAAAARGGSLYGQALNAGQAQMQAYAAQAGILGDALTALGTKGLAGAAAIGGLTLAYKAASDQAHELGQKAIDLKKFADTTGLSTNQVQALRIEASKVGVGSEEAETALQRFTVSFEELRHGSSQALDMLRRYRPDLADQMQGVEDTASAITILSKAYDGLSVSAQNALSRAFFGRGGIEMSRLMQGLNLDTATEKFASSGRGMTDELATKLKELEITSQRLNKQLGEGMAKLFAQDLLERENQFKQGLINIFAELKNFQPPEWLSKLNDIGKWLGQNLTGAGLAAQFVTSKAAEKPATFAERFGDFPSTPTAAIMPTAPGFKLPTAALQDYQQLKQVLGELTSVTDAVRAKQLELAVAQEKGINLTHEQTAALLAHTQVQAEFAQIAPGTYERQLAAMEELKAAYPDLTAAEAQRMRQLDQQLALVSALTGAERMAAQEAITYQNEKAKGATVEQAALVAAKERAITQAQINAGAQLSLAALQSQSAVANARTTDERLAAQEIATQVNLMRQGVSEELAAAVAAQERANAEDQINVAFEKQLALAQAVTGLQKIQVMDSREAAVAIAEATSNVERQTEALRQQNQMTEAKQLAGDDPVQGLINQQAVAYQQAYNNAINQGAEEQAALNLAKQTHLSYEYKINDALDQQNAKMLQAQEQAAKADYAAALARIAEEKAAQERANQGAVSAAAGLSQILQQLNDLNDHTYDYFRNLAIGFMSVQQALTMASALQAQLTKVQKQQKAEAEQKQKEEEQKQQAEAARQKYQGFEDQIQQLQNQRALAEARKVSPEAEAQVQSQQAYAKAIADGATAAQAQQIADLTLANALAQNTSAVQSNTEALSPYYASDPRLSHLGFRAGSSALGYDPFAQPATGAAGPAALPLGSTATPGGLPSMPSPSIAPSEEEGHWVGGGPTAYRWVGSGPPDYSQLKNMPMMLAGGGGIPAPGATEPLWQIPSAGTGAAAFRIPATSSGGIPATSSGGSEPSFSAGRPVQVVQNFNAPVDRSVAAEMKISAYQAAQAGMRSLRAVR